MSTATCSRLIQKQDSRRLRGWLKRVIHLRKLTDSWVGFTYGGYMVDSWEWFTYGSFFDSWAWFTHGGWLIHEHDLLIAAFWFMSMIHLRRLVDLWSWFTYGSFLIHEHDSPIQRLVDSWAWFTYGGWLIQKNDLLTAAGWFRTPMLKPNRKDVPNTMTNVVKARLMLSPWSTITLWIYDTIIISLPLYAASCIIRGLSRPVQQLLHRIPQHQGFGFLIEIPHYPVFAVFAARLVGTRE